MDGQEYTGGRECIEPILWERFGIQAVGMWQWLIASGELDEMPPPDWNPVGSAVRRMQRLDAMGRHYRVWRAAMRCWEVAGQCATENAFRGPLANARELSMRIGTTMRDLQSVAQRLDRDGVQSEARSELALCAHGLLPRLAATRRYVEALISTLEEGFEAPVRAQWRQRNSTELRREVRDWLREARPRFTYREIAKLLGVLGKAPHEAVRKW